MISLIVGISFAVFSVNLSGRQAQSINTGCLKVVMQDNGSLNLQGAYPITDEDGLASNPYTYTIENTCSVDAYYEAMLNVLSGSNTSNLSKIKIALDGDSYLKPTFENRLPQGTLLEAEANVIQTYKLDEGFLRVGETKTFNLRTWIDYNVEEISGKIENKVIIQSEARNNSTLVYNTNSAAYFSGNKQTLLKNVNYKQVSNESGIVEVKDGSNTKYFYRGNPNNEVAFGTYNSATGGHAVGESIKWKILSTNNDGSINLITTESIGNSTYSNVNSMLTSFYNTHLSDEESYIKTDSTFCKEGATSGEYLGKLRTEANNPTSKCNGNSVFTKIGLPTVDELMYAGGVLDTQNSSYYLYGGSFLTGTSASSSTIYASSQNKSIYEVSNSTSLGVRPVITLIADTMLSGTGTSTNPYYVTGKYSNPGSISTDSEKPVITYARVEEQWSKTNKPIEISAKDNVGIVGYLVKNSNTAPDANDSGWEAAASNKYITINTYDNGTYYVFAKDDAGNVSSGEKVVVERIDKTAPTCTIRVNSAPDETDAKTLTIMSNDTNIDLKGYSWGDDASINTATRKITEYGVYTGHLTDLAGNQGSCQVTVTSISLMFANQEISKTYSTSSQTASITPATKGVGTITYTEKSERNESGVSTNYISISGTTINIAANTPAGTYTYVITALDSGSNREKDAIYTIKINPIPVTITASDQTIIHGDSIATGTSKVNVTGLASGHSLSNITLTPSTNDVTTNGTITPSNATIVDGSQNDVTSNYAFTYNTGVLKINYAINYYAGSEASATGLPSKQGKVPGTNITLEDDVPTVSSTNPVSSTSTTSCKVFLGWADASSATGTDTWYDPEQTYTDDADLNLYAQWFDVCNLEKDYTRFVQTGDFTYKDHSFTAVTGTQTNNSVSFDYDSTWTAISGYTDSVLMGYIGTPLRTFNISDSIYAGRKVISASGTQHLYKLYIKNRASTVYSDDIDTRIDRLQKLDDVTLKFTDIKTVSKVHDNLTVKPGYNPLNVTNSPDSGYEYITNAGFNITNGSSSGINMSRCYIAANYFQNTDSGKINRMYILNSDLSTSTTNAKVKLTTYFVEALKKTARTTTYTPTGVKGLSRYNELTTLANGLSTYRFLPDDLKIFTANGSEVTLAAWGTGTATKSVSIPNGRILGIVEHGVLNGSGGSNMSAASINMVYASGMNTTSGSLQMRFYGANTVNTSNTGTAMTKVYGRGRIIYISKGSMTAS